MVNRPNGSELTMDSFCKDRTFDTAQTNPLLWIRNHRFIDDEISSPNKAESSQSVDYSRDQTLDDLVTGIADVPIATLATNIGG